LPAPVDAGNRGIRSVLLVCAANTARSVMAQHLLLRELGARKSDQQIIVRSAGIAAFARDGALVSLDTRMALREGGIEIGEDATSTDLKRHPELLQSADLILTMTSAQMRDLKAVFPAFDTRRISTFKSFAGEEGDIDDPVEKGHDAFVRCLEEIKRLVPRIADRLMAASQIFDGAIR
jgi:protein-tyrosine-phosphatase